MQWMIDGQPPPGFTIVDRGLTPLAEACSAGDLDKVKSLLENGDSHVNFNQCHEFAWALGSKNIELVDYLYNRYDISLESEFLSACENSSLEIIKHLVSLNPNFKCDAGNETIIGACRCNDPGRSQVLQFLLQQPWIDSSTINYNRAIIEACSVGNIESVRLLLEHMGIIDDVNYENVKTVVQLCKDSHIINGQELIRYILHEQCNLNI